VGHIPPTVDSYHFTGLWHDSYVAKYTDLIARHADAISGQLFAHMHCDTFRLMPGARHPIFVSGAVSPIFANSPSFRIWTYHDAELVDFTVYAAQLLETGPQHELKFAPFYTARERFNLTSLEAAEWQHQVAGRLEVSESVWTHYLSALWLRDDTTWTQAFRLRSACATRHLREDDFGACVASLAG